MSDKQGDLLPATLEPLDNPPRVEVDLEPALTDEQLTRALAEAGGVKITAANLDQLRRIGIKLKGLGVTHIQRGSVMVDQAKCDEVLDMLRAAIARRIAENKPRNLTADITRIAASFALLMGKKTDVQRLALEIEQAVAPSGAPVEEKPMALPGFVPGKKIVPAGGTLVVAKTVNLTGGS